MSSLEGPKPTKKDIPALQPEELTDGVYKTVEIKRPVLSIEIKYDNEDEKAMRIESFQTILKACDAKIAEGSEDESNVYLAYIMRELIEKEKVDILELRVRLPKPINEEMLQKASREANKLATIQVVMPGMPGYKAGKNPANNVVEFRRPSTSEVAQVADKRAEVINAYSKTEAQEEVGQTRTGTMAAGTEQKTPDLEPIIIDENNRVILEKMRSDTIEKMREEKDGEFNPVFKYPIMILDALLKNKTVNYNDLVRQLDEESGKAYSVMSKRLFARVFSEIKKENDLKKAA